MEDYSLEEISGFICSDRIKQRQDGLVKLLSTFSSTSRVEQVGSKGLQLIFGALHQAHRKELETVTKKGAIDPSSITGPSSVAVRRLQEVAHTFRSLVERSAKMMLRKTAREVLDYAFSNLKYRGRLLQPVALDYLRSIEIMLQWKPHLEHLTPDTSVQFLSLGLNIILEDPLKTELEVTEEVHGQTPSSNAGSSDEAESEAEEGTTSSPKKKRKMPSTYAQRRPTPVTGLSDVQPKSATPEKVAAAAILRAILTASVSPLISSSYPSLPAAILDRFQRFLHAYPQKSTLHPDLLIALSSVLSHCSLNRSVSVAHFARGSWSALVGLWGNKDVKERLVVIIRMLLPFLAVDDERFGPTWDCSAELNKLWRCLEKDVHSAGKIEHLSLDSLRLQLLSTTENQRAFVAKTFRYGWMFDAKQALAWAILELYADCVARVSLPSPCTYLMLTHSSSCLRCRNPYRRRNRATGRESSWRNPFALCLPPSKPTWMRILERIIYNVCSF